MKAIDSRIRRLQQQLCPEVGQPQRLWVAIQAGCELARGFGRNQEQIGFGGDGPARHF
jgi:hypothetical protein